MPGRGAHAGHCRHAPRGLDDKLVLGCRVIAELLEVSRRRGCYKTILDCSQDNVGFYEKAGLSVKGVQMVG